MKQELILATAQPFVVTDSSLLIETTVGEFLNQAYFILAQREKLDNDPDWSHFRQLIPYIVVVDEKNRILTYTRTAKGGEARLHNCVSIGWGGHIDLDDVYSIDSVVDLEQTIAGCAYREIEEELGWELPHFHAEPSPNAFILSDRDAVSRVHLGVVRTVLVPSSLELNIEDSAKLLGWKTFDELRAMGEEGQLEAWSLALVTEPDSVESLLSVARPL